VHLVVVFVVDGGLGNVRVDRAEGGRGVINLVDINGEVRVEVGRVGVCVVSDASDVLGDTADSLSASQTSSR
jgi:hypothetical protein